jgi:hypothetical protein
MNSTITFNIENAKEVEKAVMLVFGAKYSELIGTTDTTCKKVVVFILKHYFNFNQRHLARTYSVNYLYVPTIVDQMIYQVKVDGVFSEKVNRVLENIGYGIKEMEILKAV